MIVASGYRGPIGILGHTMDDAEERLKDNLDGLDWLVPQLEGNPPGPRTSAAHARPAATRSQAESSGRRGPSPGATDWRRRHRTTPLWSPLSFDDARQHGDPLHGAEVFASPKFACLSCHQVGDQGAMIGPDLSTVGACLKPEEVVESILWPRRQVKDELRGVHRRHRDGKMRQGYKVRRDAGRAGVPRPGLGGAISASPGATSRRSARMGR